MARLLTVLTKYLGDAAPLGQEPPSRASPARSGWPLAALQAHRSLTAASHRLARPRHAPYPPPQPRPGNAAAGNLAAAAASLMLARDLLHTHLNPGRGPRSEWGLVLTSAPLSRALLAEVGGCARQAVAVAAVTGQSLRGCRGELGGMSARFTDAALDLHAAAQALLAAHRNDPARTADLELLHAIPLNSPPARSLPGPADHPAALAAGAVRTAERTRHAAWQQGPAWSPELCDTSLRRTAASCVIISHHCATALGLLAGHAAELGSATSASSLRDAAQDAAGARAGWLATAGAWGEAIATDTTGRRSAVCEEAGDLALWTGRLVFRDPSWTPARGRKHDLRSPSELAAHPGGARDVIAAVHSAAHTLLALAEEEAGQVRAAAAAGRLHTPARRLPDWYDPARAYGPALPSLLAGLLDSYETAWKASSQLAAAAARLGEATRSPTRILTAAHAAITGTTAYTARTAAPGPPEAAGAGGDPLPARLRRAERDILVGYETGAPLSALATRYAAGTPRIRALLTLNGMPVRQGPMPGPRPGSATPRLAAPGPPEM
jgi:hypothetical protein